MEGWLVFIRILKGKKINTKICMYETWDPLVLPNSFIDISDMVSGKRSLIEFYKSQIKRYELSGQDIIIK